MNLQAKFPAGTTSITVHGLHQWDYGRKLDIQSANLAGLTVVEVHFVYAGITEAIIRTSQVSLQSTTVAIPDACLKQTAPVLAWVYCTNETEGFTVLKITLPVIARAKPGAITTPPESYTSQYLDLIAAANAIIANTYTRAQIDAALGAYITDVDALIGGST